MWEREERLEQHPSGVVERWFWNTGRITFRLKHEKFITTDRKVECVGADVGMEIGVSVEVWGRSLLIATSW